MATSAEEAAEWKRKESLRAVAAREAAWPAAAGLQAEGKGKKMTSSHPWKAEGQPFHPHQTWRSEAGEAAAWMWMPEAKTTRLAASGAETP